MRRLKVIRMPTNEFIAISGRLPCGPWQHSDEPAFKTARSRFLARLERGGSGPAGSDAHVAHRLSGVCDRASLLSAIADMEGALARRGRPCGRNLLLEAAAAFYGLPSWDALSAVLPRVAGRHDAAGMLRERGFAWASSGGSLVLAGQAGEPQGWVWCRMEAEPEQAGLAPAYVNVAAFVEDFAEHGVAEAAPQADGAVIVEVCRDGDWDRPDWVVLPFGKALEVIDRRLYLDRNAWSEMKQHVGGPHDGRTNTVPSRGPAAG